MSHIEKRKGKRGISLRIHYTFQNKHYTETFGPLIDKNIVKARAQEIDRKIQLHKAGLKTFTPHAAGLIHDMQLKHFPEWYRSTRLNNPDNTALPETIDRYVRAIRVFARSVGNDLFLASINNSHIQQFKMSEKRLGKNERGINKNLHHLKHPFKLAYEYGLIKEIPKIVLFKVTRQLPDTLSPEEIELLESHIDGGQTKLAFVILKWTGMRRSEVIRLHKKDINIPQKYILITGKIGEERTVPMHPRLIEFLQTNPIYQSHPPDAPLLTIHKDTITKAVYKAKQKAGIRRRMSAHLLRHSLGRYLINRLDEPRFTLRDVQQILGHKTLQMTIRYTQVEDKALMEKFKQISYEGEK